MPMVTKKKKKEKLSDLFTVVSWPFSTHLIANFCFPTTIHLETIKPFFFINAWFIKILLLSWVDVLWGQRRNQLLLLTFVASFKG